VAGAGSGWFCAAAGEYVALSASKKAIAAPRPRESQEKLSESADVLARQNQEFMAGVVVNDVKHFY
jgi:hypothetical protein